MELSICFPFLSYIPFFMPETCILRTNSFQSIVSMVWIIRMKFYGLFLCNVCVVSNPTVCTIEHGCFCIKPYKAIDFLFLATSWQWFVVSMGLLPSLFPLLCYVFLAQHHSPTNHTFSSYAFQLKFLCVLRMMNYCQFRLSWFMDAPSILFFLATWFFYKCISLLWCLFMTYENWISGIHFKQNKRICTPSD